MNCTYTHTATASSITFTTNQVFFDFDPPPKMIGVPIMHRRSKLASYRSCVVYHNLSCFFVFFFTVCQLLLPRRRHSGQQATTLAGGRHKKKNAMSVMLLFLHDHNVSSFLVGSDDGAGAGNTDFEVSEYTYCPSAQSQSPNWNCKNGGNLLIFHHILMA